MTRVGGEIPRSRAPNWVAVHEKASYVLSRCHTKRRTGARGRDRPFFFKSVSYQKKRGRGHARARPSIGMTTTQAIRALFGNAAHLWTTLSPGIQIQILKDVNPIP